MCGRIAMAATRSSRSPTFARVLELRFVNIYHPEEMLQALKRRVNQQINRLQRMFPEGRQTYAPLRKQLLQLGVTPQTA